MTSFRNPGIVNQALKNGWINNTYDDNEEQYNGYTFNPQKQNTPGIYNHSDYYGQTRDAHDLEVEKALSALYGNYLNENGRLKSQNNALQTLNNNPQQNNTALNPYDMDESLYSKIINGGDIPKQQLVESFTLPKISRKEKFSNEENIPTTTIPQSAISNSQLNSCNTHSSNYCIQWNQQTFTIIIVVALLVMFGFIIYTSVQNTQSQRRIEMLLNMNMRNIATN